MQYGAEYTVFWYNDVIMKYAFYLNEQANWEHWTHYQWISEYNFTIIYIFTSAILINTTGRLEGKAIMMDGETKVWENIGLGNRIANFDINTPPNITPVEFIAPSANEIVDTRVMIQYTAAIDSLGYELLYAIYYSLNSDSDN